MCLCSIFKFTQKIFLVKLKYRTQTHLLFFKKNIFGYIERKNSFKFFWLNLNIEHKHILKKLKTNIYTIVSRPHIVPVVYIGICCHFCINFCTAISVAHLCGCATESGISVAHLLHAPQKWLSQFFCRGPPIFLWRMFPGATETHIFVAHPGPCVTEKVW